MLVLVQLVVQRQRQVVVQRGLLQAMVGLRPPAVLASPPVLGPGPGREPGLVLVLGLAFPPVLEP